jgi:hypothetical protein
MITKKLIIIFLLIIALIIILIVKHKNKKVEIENFILNLDIQEENDYDNIVSTYYNNNIDYVPIINKFGIIETNNVNLQQYINSSNTLFIYQAFSSLIMSARLRRSLNFPFIFSSN